MGLLLVFASLKLQLSALPHGLNYISLILGRRYIDPDVGGNFKRMLTNFLSVLIRSNKMQQYAGIYLLQVYFTCFGRPSRPSSGVQKL